MKYLFCFYAVLFLFPHQARSQALAVKFTGKAFKACKVSDDRDNWNFQAISPCVRAEKRALRACNEAGMLFCKNSGEVKVSYYQFGILCEGHAEGLR